MAKEKFEIRGLRNCLRKYDEKGDYAKSGKWSIATGGYDLYWQLYYEEEPLIDNVCNELMVDNRYDYSNLNEVISIILEEYKNVKISSEEWYKKIEKKINIEQKLKSIMERVIQENCNFEDFGYIESDKIGDSILVQTSKYCDGRYFVNSGYTTLSRHIDKLLREDYEYTFDELKKEYPKKDDDEISEMMHEIDEHSAAAVYFTIKLHYFTDEGKGLAELVVEESNFYSDMVNENDSVYKKWFNGLNEKVIEKALKEVCKEYNSINFSIKGNNKTNMSIKDKNEILQKCDKYADNMYSNEKDKKLFKKGCNSWLEQGKLPEGLRDYYNRGDAWVIKDGFNYAKELCIENKTNMSIKDKKGAYEFKNSNLRFHGMKMDINGNPCFVLSTPNQRAFSVQQPYSITIHWSTKNGNSKESGIEIVEKNTKGNPFKSEEEFEDYVLHLAEGRKHVKAYGNNFACGKGNFDLVDFAKKKSMYEVGDIVETQTINGLVKGVVEKKLYAELNPPVWIYTINGKLADGTPYMANSVREEDIISSINKGFEPMKHSVAMKNVTKFKEQGLDPIFKAHNEECKKMGLGTKDCNKLWEEKYKPMYEEKKAQFDKILKESWLAEGYKTTGTTEKHKTNMSIKDTLYNGGILMF